MPAGDCVCVAWWCCLVAGVARSYGGCAVLLWAVGAGHASDAVII